jgi:hypothetical protein
VFFHGISRLSLLAAAQQILQPKEVPSKRVILATQSFDMLKAVDPIGLGRELDELRAAFGHGLLISVSTQ